ncbi:hypothetical protein [Rhodoferax sp. TS-BS-61-7]|uniref:hypothetical protein n=1 Tax=Rhodoferax sp. TS-BS-61-7 TaxID=2094194 RepID=UPI000CF6298A|nr:hypothetical protein [Rhodoferax sp. TS-BS-61-7]PQA79150.1 hypothetical protein C5F53_04155 [Rhodoferax sp. TS-BS-61-7]
MSDQPSREFYAKFVLVLAVLLIFPAVWSFFSAVYYAATSGQVLVISLGRYGTAREFVAWELGWARFVGPALLVASLVVWGRAAQSTIAWWLAVALAVIGSFLLLFSQWFTSLHRTMFFAGLNIFVAATVFAGNRYGRAAAYATIALGISFFLWRVAVAA